MLHLVANRKGIIVILGTCETRTSLHESFKVKDGKTTGQILVNYKVKKWPILILKATCTKFEYQLYTERKKEKRVFIKVQLLTSDYVHPPTKQVLCKIAVL